MSETKSIILTEPKSKTVATEKPKVKRVVTTTDKWSFNCADLTPETQRKFLNQLLDTSVKDVCKTSEFILKQINNKVSGYRSQDVEKNLLNLDLFVNRNNVLEIFRSSGLNCYYCKEFTLIIYEYVRDPKQWTLDRLDNSLGHNRDNVVLSCLRCNLRRRTMHSDRYLKTKAMAKIVKIDDTDSSHS